MRPSVPSKSSMKSLLGLSLDDMHALQHDFFGTVPVADRVATVPPALPFIVLDALLEAGMDTEERFDELPDAPLELALERIASIMLCQDLDEDGQVHILDMAFLVLRTAGIVRRDNELGPFDTRRLRTLFRFHALPAPPRPGSRHPPLHIPPAVLRRLPDGIR